jgi:hypothetical protein
VKFSEFAHRDDDRRQTWECAIELREKDVQKKIHMMQKENLEV